MKNTRAPVVSEIERADRRARVWAGARERRESHARKMSQWTMTTIRLTPTLTFVDYVAK